MNLLSGNMWISLCQMLGWGTLCNEPSRKTLREIEITSSPVLIGMIASICTVQYVFTSELPTMNAGGGGQAGMEYHHLAPHGTATSQEQAGEAFPTISSVPLCQHPTPPLPLSDGLDLPVPSPAPWRWQRRWVVAAWHLPPSSPPSPSPLLCPYHHGSTPSPLSSLTGNLLDDGRDRGADEASALPPPPCATTASRE